MITTTTPALHVNPFREAERLLRDFREVVRDNHTSSVNVVDDRFREAFTQVIRPYFDSLGFTVRASAFPFGDRTGIEVNAYKRDTGQHIIFSDASFERVVCQVLVHVYTLSMPLFDSKLLDDTRTLCEDYVEMVAAEQKRDRERESSPCCASCATAGKTPSKGPCR